jgi:glycosyltransferase involved in cell wall biosynthesis
MISQNLSFSLIIPAKNAGRTLSGCLDAAAQSSAAPSEVIVVNDGSGDQTGEIAVRHGARVITASIGKGPMQPRFLGAGASRHPILIFLDSDVRVRPGTFEKILRHFADPEIHAVTGTLSRVSSGLGFFSAFKNEYMNFIFSMQPRRSRFLYGSIWAIRRESLVPFEPIVEPFGSLVSDTELGLRLAGEGKAVILDHEIEVDHRKKYTFLRLMKNDFVIPFMFSLAFLKYAPRECRVREGRAGVSFSHASLGQTAAAASAWLSVLSAALFLKTGSFPAILMTAAGLAHVYLFWAPFLFRLSKSKGFIFSLRAALLILPDAAVMFTGMLAGFIYGAFRPVTKPPCLKSA